ncbi:MAG: FG-GAP repeat protein, partial [Anaerolineales bacterium]|nr:FG-GAP repeat protein [Anaerolineales bacterium]
FGWSVAVSGDLLAVGVPLRGTDNRGKVYLYQRAVGGGWAFLKAILPSIPGPNDRFGESVAFGGDALFASAPSADVLRYGGAVYVFLRDQGGADNWGQWKKIEGDIAYAERIGFWIDTQDDLLIAGGREVAYIYDRHRGGENEWGVVKRLSASPPGTGAGFGISTALCGTTAFVGAWYDGNMRGTAFVLEEASGGPSNWGQTQTLLSSNGQEQDYLGESVDCSGSLAVVGARYGDGPVADTGAAYLFDRNPETGEYRETHALAASNLIDQTFFGAQVRLVGRQVLIGARQADFACPTNPDCNSGAVYVFSLDLFQDSFESGSTVRWSAVGD